ncbi:hypothetical protein MRX96_055573 [Rhipicephalus microplus]
MLAAASASSPHPVLFTTDTSPSHGEPSPILGAKPLTGSQGLSGQRGSRDRLAAAAFSTTVVRRALLLPCIVHDRGCETQTARVGPSKLTAPSAALLTPHTIHPSRRRHA